MECIKYMYLTYVTFSVSFGLDKFLCFALHTDLRTRDVVYSTDGL